MNRILLLIFLGCITVISSGGELFQLENGTWNIINKERLNDLVKVEIVSMEGTNRQVPAVAWGKLESISTKSLLLGMRKSVMTLDEFAQAEFILTLQVEKELPLRRIVIRLRDKTGEIFQIAPTTTGALKPGKNELHYIFDATDPSKSTGNIWAGNGDKKVDWPLQLSGIAIDLNSKTPDNERILLDSLEVQFQGERCSIALDTGHPIHLLLPDQKSQPVLVVKNLGNASSELSGSLKITNLQEQICTEKASVAVPASGEARITIPGDYTQTGWWKVDYQLRSTAGKEYTGTHRFARMNPAGPTPGRAEEFLFGLCAHPNKLFFTSPQQAELEAIASGLCGAKIVRVDFSWAQIEPERNKWDFSIHDRIVDANQRHGVELQAIIGFTVRWAVPADRKPKNPDTKRGFLLPDVEEYAKFAGAVATHYKNQVKYYEIWNEPDLIGFANFPFESYMELLRSGYDSIKRSNPEAVVMNGGIANFGSNAGGNPKHNNGWVELLRADGGKHFDLFAFHGHGAFRSYANQLRQLKQCGLIGPSAPRPWYSNETAETSSSIGEHLQAESVFKKLLYAWSEGAMGYNWYLLREKDYYPIGHHERHFGLITAEFEPKPAFLSYNMLASIYKGGRFLRQIELTPQVIACLFQNPQGDGLLALWSEDISQQLLLSGLPQNTTRIDLFGNEEPVTVSNGVAWLNISKKPFTLRIPQIASHDLRNAGSFFAGTIPRQLVIPANGSGELTLPLVNPLPQSLSLEVRLEAPRELTASPSHRTITLPAGGRETLRIRLVAESGFNATPTQPAFLRYSVAPAGQVADAILLPIVSQATGNAPLFRLNQEAQYNSLVETIPGNEPLYWSGPKDLSADVYLSRKGETLQLRVEVTDDKQEQPYRGSEVWNGDNVQFSLALPEQNGFWKLGLTRLADGSSETYCWNAPNGFKEDASAIRLETQRNEDKKLTIYRAEIPFKAVGLTVATAKTGFRFNLIVNDNDGNRREGFIAVAPGLGANDGAVSLWPTVNLR